MSIDFKPSDKVSTIKSGRTRDDSYDKFVSAAYAEKGKVFEATVKTETVDDVRKGLQRSAHFLNVRIAGPEYQDNGDGTTTVFFSAHDKMPRNGSRKVETADASADSTETATVETGDKNKGKAAKTAEPAKV